MLDSGVRNEATYDVVSCIDTEDNGGEPAMRIICGGKASIGENEAMNLRSIIVIANHLTTLINRENGRVGRARNINGFEVTMQ